MTLKDTDKESFYNDEIEFPNIDIMITLSSTKHLYSREAESILETLGDIGGFNDIVTIFVFLIMGNYTQTMFEGRLVKGTKFEEIERKYRYNAGVGHLRNMQQKLQANENV